MRLLNGDGLLINKIGIFMMNMMDIISYLSLNLIVIIETMKVL